MKLVYYELDLKIEFNENKVTLLVLESPCLFQKVVTDLYQQSLGDQQFYVLSENQKELEFNKQVDVVLSPLNIDLNNKKIISRVYGHLSDLANEELNKKLELNNSVYCYLENLVSSSNYPFLEINIDPRWDNLFKMYDIKVRDETESLLERINEYLKLNSSLMNYELFVFVGLKQFLDDDQLEELYKMIELLKLHVLLIESNDSRYNSYEDMYIFDQDLCLIRR